MAIVKGNTDPEGTGTIVKDDDTLSIPTADALGLADTGSPVTVLGLAGVAALLTVGALLIFAGRRRRRA